jgi:molybdopterin-guanine dinucleotide biosynthesis protein A
MSPKLTNIAGVLLAGGQSRRMGQDKRFLSLEGRSLLERSLSVLEQLCDEILVVVARPAPELGSLRHRVVTDVIPNSGSLGGLYTGLSESTAPRVFAAACDMPFLSPEAIVYLAERDPSADIVMPRLEPGLQPLHAIYHKRCIPVLEGMIRRRSLAIHDLVKDPALHVTLVTESELRPIDPLLQSFVNINTPEELDRARSSTSR